VLSLQKDAEFLSALLAEKRRSTDNNNNNNGTVVVVVRPALSMLDVRRMLHVELYRLAQKNSAAGSVE